MSVGSAVSEATLGAVEWAPGLCLRGERPRLADYRLVWEASDGKARLYQVR